MSDNYCVTCSVPTKKPRRSCSTECLNAERRAKYALNPRPRVQRPSLAERLWARVIEQPNGCWEWQGYRMPFGYGQMGLGTGRAGGTITTHRAAWVVTHGAIPADLIVRHRCDNPPCCNPSHLELGTTADNSRDAVERGRMARGFQLPNTVLSPEQVLEIRRDYRRFTVPGVRGYRSNKRELAERYGVSAKYIVAIAGNQERADV